jgi:tetratricopeptide (TPR) repeat protein
MKLGFSFRQSSRLVVLLAIVLLVGWPIGVALRRGQVETLAQRCREAVQKEDWISAAPLAEEWARRAPGDAEAWIQLADVAKAQGDFEATAESLRRIPATDARYVNSQLMRADLLLNALNRPYDAVAAWRDVLAVVPNHPVPHQRILYIESMTLQRQQLAQQIREAIRQRAEPPEAYGYLLSIPNLMFTDGYIRVEKWLKANPEDETLQVAYAIFRERSSGGREIRDFGTSGAGGPADTPFQIALKKYPHNLELLAYQIDGIISRADLPALGKALQDLPPEAENDSRFWRFIATYQDSQQKTKDAATSLRRAVELHPLDWKAHHELGTIERVLGNAEAAARHAELGARGKLLERRFFELANAAQADPPLLRATLRYAKDCGDADAVSGLTYRLQESDELEGPE